METANSDQPTDGVPVQAHDVMTAKVVTVGVDAPTRDIARLLLENGVSAVPVVSPDGTPVGMVSEGDLIGRPELDRLSRRDWWLAVLTGKQPLDVAFQARIEATDRTARDVMSAPLVTVTEQTSVGDIARLLAIHHIKRVPVVREGLLVGIVSRADLLGVVATEHRATQAHKDGYRGFRALFGGQMHHPAADPGVPAAPAHETPHADGLTVEDFRKLVTDFHDDEARHRDEARRAAALRRRERTRALIDAHVFDDAWREMLHHARVAAENGQTEYMILQFPSGLCIDGGRAINVAEEGWPATLRGEAAEIYLRWERDLKHRGFGLSAHVTDFPDGKPGDIGLFLVWQGEADGPAG